MTGPKNGQRQPKTLDEIIDTYSQRPEPEPALPRPPGRWVENVDMTWTYVLNKPSQECPVVEPTQEPDLSTAEDGQEEYIHLWIPNSEPERQD
jgi:hypothetical protein